MKNNLPKLEEWKKSNLIYIQKLFNEEYWKKYESNIGCITKSQSNDDDLKTMAWPEGKTKAPQTQSHGKLGKKL